MGERDDTGEHAKDHRSTTTASFSHATPSEQVVHSAHPGGAMALELSSTAFGKNGAIPVAHTCDGAGTPPPLEWRGAPTDTKTFVLIVDDPDAPDPKAP